MLSGMRIRLFRAVHTQSSLGLASAISPVLVFFPAPPSVASLRSPRPSYALFSTISLDTTVSARHAAFAA
eukprot:5932200-Pleurochrysis_carterae.AAC.2